MERWRGGEMEGWRDGRELLYNGDGYEELAGVAHGVFSNMKEKPDYRGGELFSAYTSWFGK